MDLQNRINLLIHLGEYLKNPDENWATTVEKASQKNAWFTPEFIGLAAKNIADNFLQKPPLERLAAHYHLDDNIVPKNVGIVMAGNIPMVGFHDMLCVFLCGHRQTIKLSSNDDVLIKYMVEWMAKQLPEVTENIAFADSLRGCDAYIATGSNNTSRYFEQYFGKWPNIIRKNRTSVALLSGAENAEELEKLADDVHLYFGLGCRNVTKIYVPKDYDFKPLLKVFDKYGYFMEHHKYKNNFDYQYSILLLGRQPHIWNETALLAENKNIFSPIAQLNYEYYEDVESVKKLLNNLPDIQCIVGKDFVPFGQAQCPAIDTYADGVDTMEFLLGI